MKCLVKFQCDWADEHNVYGFRVFDDRKTFEKQLAYAKAYWEVYPNKEVEIYFGTNECLTFECYESYSSCFELIDCTEEDYQVLKDKFLSYRDRVDWGFTGAMAFTEYTLDNGEDNPKLLNLAANLWPEDRMLFLQPEEVDEDFWCVN